MPLIDTLMLKTGLVDAGMDSAQADAIVKTLVQAGTEHLATKEDIATITGVLTLMWMCGVILGFLVLVMGKLFFPGASGTP